MKIGGKVPLCSENAGKTTIFFNNDICQPVTGQKACIPMLDTHVLDANMIPSEIALGWGTGGLSVPPNSLLQQSLSLPAVRFSEHFTQKLLGSHI